MSDDSQKSVEFESSLPPANVPLRVLVCGSRDWTNRARIHTELKRLPAGTTIVHGCCRGADRIAGEVAKSLGFYVIEFPADWDLHGKAAGPIRNSQMLAEGRPHFVIA